MKAVVGGMNEGSSEEKAERRPLAGDEGGVAYVEYIVLVMLVGVLVAAAILAVGLPLLEHFRMTQSVLGAPIP